MSLLEQETYTTEELANLLGVTTRTIRNYLREGKIKGYKIGGKWQFYKQDIEEYIQGQKSELMDIDSLHELRLDTCKIIFNFHVDLDKQEGFFQRVTKVFNDYEKYHEENINCRLSCLSKNKKMVEVIIAGELEHIMNLANSIKG